MRYWTYGEIKRKVERDLDLGSAEGFITDDEMLGYYNEAVDHAEAEIHTLYEDYFLTSAEFPIVNGVSDYSLPSDIFATKIRGLVYSNGSQIYSIPRIRDWRKFEEVALSQTYESSFAYQYILKNPSAQSGIKLMLFPAAKETSSHITIWYIRNANRAESESDLCDIPEFASFIIAFMKVKIATKEQSAALTVFVQELQYLRDHMRSTLRDKVPDGDTSIEMDMSAYQEMT